MNLRSDASPTFARTLVDLLFSTLIFLSVILVLLALIAHEEKTSKKQEQANATIEAVLMITITWPVGDQDIDLWVAGPDGVPVGYRNTRSGVLGYLKDDVGRDFSGKNFELITAQGSAPGEYLVNVHLFSMHGAALSVTVHAQIVSFRQNNGAEVIYETDIELVHEYQEKTVLRFIMLPDGTVDKTSFSDDFKSMQEFSK